MQKSNINKNKILLVDNDDNVIGLSEKIIAHQNGLLHRAFSVFCFNHNHEVLLHRRSEKKYHCPGLWTNACCSHSIENEETIVTAQKRLMFEMGINAKIAYIKPFTYRAALGNGMIEHEINHVFISISDHFQIKPNKEEVDAFCWQKISCLEQELLENPKKFTPWLQQALTIAKEGYLASR